MVIVPSASGCWGALPSERDIAARADNDGPGYEIVIFDVATMKVRRRIAIDRIPSATWTSADELLVRTKGELSTIDVRTGKKTPVANEDVVNVFGDTTTGALAHLNGPHLGVWRPASHDLVDVGPLADGDVATNGGLLWTWGKQGLVRVDIAKLRSALPTR